MVTSMLPCDWSNGSVTNWASTCSTHSIPIALKVRNPSALKFCNNLTGRLPTGWFSLPATLETPLPLVKLFDRPINYPLSAICRALPQFRLRERIPSIAASGRDLPSENRSRPIQLLPFFFQAEDGIRDGRVTGVQTCALPI